MLEQGEPGTREGESSDAAVRVSAARQDNIVTGLKEEFVSLLKKCVLWSISVEEVGLWRFLWLYVTTCIKA